MAEADKPDAKAPFSQFILRAASLLVFLWWAGVLTTTLLLASAHGVPRTAIKCVLAGLLASAVGVPLFRHIVIAAVAVATPLSGILVAAAIAGYLHLNQLSADAFLPFGIAASFLAADTFLARIRLDPARWDIATMLALGKALRPGVLGVLLSLAFLLAPIMPGATGKGVVPLGAAIQAALVFACSALLVPLSLSWLRFNESFLTRTNRTSELHHALAYRLLFVTESRWSLSLSGVSLVLATLATFAVEARFNGGAIDWKLLLLCPVWMFVIANPYVGRWRITLGFVLGLALALLFGLWAGAPSGRVSYLELAEAGAVLAAGFVLAVAMARRGRLLFGASEEDEAIARLQAVQEMAGVVVYGTLAAVVSLLPFIGSPRTVMAISLLVASEVAVLVMGPALTTALYRLLPRRRSLEEAFERI